MYMYPKLQDLFDCIHIGQSIMHASSLALHMGHGSS